MIGKLSVAAMFFAAFSATAGEVSLEKDLMPIFQRSCGTCHEPDSGIRGAIKDKTYFNTKKDLLGKVGTAIIPGKPDESLLVKVVEQEVKFGKREIVMPPAKADEPKWTKEEVEKLKAWINAGAKDN